MIDRVNVKMGYPEISVNPRERVEERKEDKVLHGFMSKIGIKQRDFNKAQITLNDRQNLL